MPAMSTEVQYSKSKKEKNSTNVITEVLVKQNITIQLSKKILIIIRRIEKFLIFLALKPFLA